MERVREGKHEIYAVYKGEEIIGTGTVYELSKMFKVRKETIYFWATPANHKRMSFKQRKRKVAVRVGQVYIKNVYRLIGYGKGIEGSLDYIAKRLHMPRTTLMFYTGPKATKRRKENGDFYLEVIGHEVIDLDDEY